MMSRVPRGEAQSSSRWTGAGSPHRRWTMVATAAVGFCPLYALLGIDTRGRRPLVHG